jgi:hypothetical protein
MKQKVRDQVPSVLKSFLVSDVVAVVMPFSRSGLAVTLILEEPTWSGL